MRKRRRRRARENRIRIAPEETRGHVERLEQVFESLDEKVRGKHCDGMAGIIEEGKSIIEEEFDEATMDACLIAAGQRAEHYEMAAYGTLVAWARGMGHERAANLLQETLDEEKAADEKLTSIAEAGINQEAADAAHPEKSDGMMRRKKTSQRCAAAADGGGRSGSEASGSSIAADHTGRGSVARAEPTPSYRPSIERRNRPSLTRSSSTIRHVWIAARTAERPVRA